MAKHSLSVADFVHLHNHTQYSLLDGLTKIPQLMEQVKSFGMESVAITDHGTLSGAIDFYTNAYNHEVKPIIGMETYVAARGHLDKDPVKDKLNNHLILLAMNNQGYQNLMRLSTIANLDGFYYKPRVDRALLEKYNEGLIVLSGCIGGEVGDAFRQGQAAKARDVAEWYKRVFGDRYYLEIQDHGHPDHPSAWPEQVEVNKQILTLGKELDIPVVLTSDAHYLHHEDQEAHEILLCVQTGSFLSDENRMSLKDFDLHVEDPKAIIERWGEKHPEVIKNTSEIAKRCEVNIELGKILIPKFPTPKNETEKSLLEKMVYQGLAWRYGGKSEKQAVKLGVAEAKKNLSKELLERAKYELDVIESMGFSGYFLIIADFINWGKDQGIVFGPGRGSAAGSIISYALKITELDPIKYDLLFERFLNPDRISMPDIDIDIQDTRRDEVIQYCVEKYGDDRVANIVTFGTMAARNAVRDVARVLQVPYAEADRLAKMIPPPIQGRHIPLATSLEEDADLKREYASNEQSRRVFDLAVRLEGTIRSHGVHAAGVVIAPDDIVKFAPLEMAQKGVVSTQYSMGPVEELGLLKMDFLGLSNLTIIKNALRIIRKVHGKNIDITEIPLDDAKTYELFQHGDTTGVFQLESAGMKRYLKELKPTVFEDIIAMVALYRPGPMQFIDQFIRRKHGKEAISYLHPKMENALKSTYGVLVYQEQFMQISKDLAGFTGGQADTLRKAVGKKIMSMMKKVKPEFVEGAVKHSGADQALMEQFWAQLEEFANYCFNKSHAACYGLIAYQTAYLKAHYPAAFMAALMTSDYDDTDRLAIEIKECQAMGLTVLPPDVNESFLEFAVVPDKKAIRFGLNAIKNVGTAAAEEIVRAREEHGHFKTLEDFFTQVNPRIANRKTVEALIKAGAFDNLGERGQLLANLDILVAFGAKVHKDEASGQADLFGTMDDLAHHSKPALRLSEDSAVTVPQREQLQWERELLGVYLSHHPLEAFKNLLEEQAVPMQELTADHHNKSAQIGGMVTAFREITTKNGSKMAFATVTDEHNDMEVVLFPNVYQQTIGIWDQDKVVIVKGKLSAQDKDGNDSGDLKLLADEAREVTHEQATAYESTGRKPKKPKAGKKKSALKAVKADPARMYIRLPDSKDQEMLLDLKKVIEANRGDTEVVLVVGSDKQVIRLPARVDSGPESVDQVVALVGAVNLKLQ